MTNRKDLCKLATALGGLPVLGCHPESPAMRAGVRYGDILIAVNGRRTPDWTAFIEARAMNPHEMDLELFRDGRSLNIVVTLDSMAIDPVEVLAEIVAERLIPLDFPDVSSPPSKPN